MISRYTLPQMGSFWTDQSRWEWWLCIELLACEAQARLGKIPAKDLRLLWKKAKINPREILSMEAEVKHDIIAFVSSVAKSIGPAGRYLHMGLTSSDVLDTAFACQLREAGLLLERDLQNIISILKKQAVQFKETPLMGRTHGMHAEPITFGLKLAGWLVEFKRQQKRLKMAMEEISVGKISGAVGTYSQVPPSVETYVLKRLKLRPETVATQVVARDRHAFFFSVLAGIAGSVERVALEIRHLSRTELGELMEPFGKKQKGSSAMPHKKNPILAENLTGLARLVRSYAIPAQENIALWHERDISHSSVERVIAPDATIALDFMLQRLAELLGGMQVYPERMWANLNPTRRVVFSQEVLSALVEKGMSRDEAYRLVQKHALANQDFQVGLARDPEVLKKISRRELAALFDWKRKLKHVDSIIKRALK